MIQQVIKDSLMITSFVMVMMLIIEYVNVQSRGTWSAPLKKNKWLQVIFGAFLGLIPGCLGTYAAVSLYTHNVISFSAITATMIATSGDEAFVMFSMIPDTALIISLAIFLIAIITGFILNFFKLGSRPMFAENKKFEIHTEEDHCHICSREVIMKQLRHISFQRSMLIFSLLVFIFLLIIGELGHDHEHTHELTRHHEEGGWDWIRMTFLVVSSIALLIVTIVPEHFLQAHLWEHIIKKHFLKLFLWIIGTLLFIHFMEKYIDFDQWLKDNQLIILAIALLVGIIPVSGPHIIFISLFFSGSIPLSILVTNSIVQDGHGSLPLLAESKKSFLYIKLINMLVGLIVGLSGYFFGW